MLRFLSLKWCFNVPFCEHLLLLYSSCNALGSLSSLEAYILGMIDGKLTNGSSYDLVPIDVVQFIATSNMSLMTVCYFAIP